MGGMVTAAVAAYGTYRLASWAWRTWYGECDHNEPPERPQQQPQNGNYHGEFDNRDNAPLATLERPPTMNPTTPHRWHTRRQRMVRCREESMNALEGFLPMLKESLEASTNTSTETLALRKLRTDRTNPQHNEALSRREESALWETIKIRSVTRMMATAYAHSILFLVVTVQVNLLGGKLFTEQLQYSSSASSMSIYSAERMAAYSESHKLVLQHTYKYFFQRGIVSLVESVERAVADVLQNWNVSDSSSLNISLASFDRVLLDIRTVEERIRVTSRSRPRSLLRFLLPPSEIVDDAVSDGLAQWMLDETWDLLESPVLLDAEHDCLEATFGRMRDHHWGKIFEKNEVDETDNARSHIATRTTTRPLAYVVTRLKHTSKSFFKVQQSPLPSPSDRTASHGFTANNYCTELELLPSTLELAGRSQ